MIKGCYPKKELRLILMAIFWKFILIMYLIFIKNKKQDHEKLKNYLLGDHHDHLFDGRRNAGFYFANGNGERRHQTFRLSRIFWECFGRFQSCRRIIINHSTSSKTNKRMGVCRFCLRLYFCKHQSFRRGWFKFPIVFPINYFGDFACFLLFLSSIKFSFNPF